MGALWQIFNKSVRGALRISLGNLQGASRHALRRNHQQGSLRNARGYLEEIISTFSPPEIRLAIGSP